MSQSIPSNSNITNIGQTRTAHTYRRAHEIIARISDQDLDILQNDRLSRPPTPSLTAVMEETFREWLDDSYGSVERETAMAPENMGNTHERFLEDACACNDETMGAMARLLLARGRPGLIQLAAP